MPLHLLQTDHNFSVWLRSAIFDISNVHDNLRLVSGTWNDLCPLCPENCSYSTCQIPHCPLTKAQYFSDLSFHINLTLSLMNLGLSQGVNMTGVRLLTDKFQIISFAPIPLFTGVFMINLNPRPTQKSWHD